MFLFMMLLIFSFFNSFCVCVVYVFRIEVLVCSFILGGYMVWLWIVNVIICIGMLYWLVRWLYCFIMLIEFDVVE